MKTKKLPYGPVNVDAFQRVKRHILEEPRRLYMGAWGTVQLMDYHFLDDDTPPCGTVACIAGWAVALNHLKTHATLRSCLFSDINKAVKILGLRELSRTTEGIVRPFHVSYWPAKFKNRYDKAKTPAGRARVAANFIDYVCGL